jgi:hypothetical protein
MYRRECMDSDNNSKLNTNGLSLFLGIHLFNIGLQLVVEEFPCVCVLGGVHLCVQHDLLLQTAVDRPLCARADLLCQ